MQKLNRITPHLWFNREAKEAAEFYCSLFPNSKVSSITTLHDTPSGDCDVVTFNLSGQSFMGISAGPLFKFNPSVSFFVNFDPSKDTNAQQNLDATWQKLSEGGTALMPLDEYPFSKRFGWIQDKFGVSWQLILTNPGGQERPFIVPSLLFVGSGCGKAEEATDFYISIFENSKRGNIFHYPQGMEPEKEGTVMFTDFKIANQWFSAMDSAREHKFNFNEAISFVVSCDTQDEIDYYWEKLSAVPESEMCGWCKDKYGLVWQVTPSILHQMLSEGTEEQINRVTQSFLKMKKFDIATLTRAFEGEVVNV
jgi:predicted 3-demethylubiquinone-9 3-methyltransferase (glyoxalase superfamily)